MKLDASLQMITDAISLTQLPTLDTFSLIEVRVRHLWSEVVIDEVSRIENFPLLDRN